MQQALHQVIKNHTFVYLSCKFWSIAWYILSLQLQRLNCVVCMCCYNEHPAQFCFSSLITHQALFFFGTIIHCLQTIPIYRRTLQMNKNKNMYYMYIPPLSFSVFFTFGSTSKRAKSSFILQKTWQKWLINRSSNRDRTINAHIFKQAQ